MLGWMLFLSLFVNAAEKPTVECRKIDLERQDCALRLGLMKVQISRLKITWNDGTWTSISDVPTGKMRASEWEKVRFENRKGRWIVEMLVWDEGKGAPKVESLHWILGELRSRSFSPVTDQIVRKRVRLEGSTSKYEYDRWIPSELRDEPNGKLRWRAGRESQEF